MNIVICEDNKQQREFIYNTLQRYAFIEYPTAKFVLKTHNPFDVIAYIDKHPVDCFFLDIELETSINGLMLASKIREHYPYASIIFVTTHADMLKLTFKYKVLALDFIVKSEEETTAIHLREALEAAFMHYKKIGETKGSPYFQIKIGELIKNIAYEDILFFKTSDNIHKIELHTVNGLFEFYGKIKETEQLSGDFYRCHKSYVVNKTQIEQIDKKTRIAKMKNGDTCPISIRFVKGIF